MTPESPESAGPMNNAREIVDSMPKAPRRYIVRRLTDALGLPQQEVAEVLGVSQPTVVRDLKATVPPAGHANGGAPFYPPGRFDNDEDFQARVRELARDIGESNARRQAAREFAGGPIRPRLRNQAADLSPERARIAEELQKA